MGKKNVITEFKPIMGGEDFACFLQKVPGTYIFLGIKEKEEIVHHQSHFDFSEEVLSLGTSLLAYIALRSDNG